MLGSEMIVRKSDIVKGLKELGLKEGTDVFVHSSLKSFGYVEGGAQTVIDALMEVIGSSGTLLMSTSPFRGYMLDYVMSGPVFDVVNTPSLLGKVTEVFRCMPGVKRSLDPTHPVCAAGERADYYIRDHHKNPYPVGSDLSPWGKLVANHGVVVFLGVTMASCTLAHAVEEDMNLPYLFYKDMFDMQVIDYDGNLMYVRTKSNNKDIKRYFTKIYDTLYDGKRIKSIYVGEALVTYVDAEYMYNEVKKIVAENKDWLITP